MECQMSLKGHFLDLPLDYFPENFGTVSEEQGKRFHQYIEEIEKGYQESWNDSMLEEEPKNIKEKSQKKHYGYEKRSRSGIRALLSHLKNDGQNKRPTCITFFLLVFFDNIF